MSGCVWVSLYAHSFYQMLVFQPFRRGNQPEGIQTVMLWKLSDWRWFWKVFLFLSVTSYCHSSSSSLPPCVPLFLSPPTFSCFLPACHSPPCLSDFPPTHTHYFHFTSPFLLLAACHAALLSLCAERLPAVRNTHFEDSRIVSRIQQLPATVTSGLCVYLCECVCETLPMHI